jgi:hypothetical protein
MEKPGFVVKPSAQKTGFHDWVKVTVALDYPFLIEAQKIVYGRGDSSIQRLRIPVVVRLEGTWQKLSGRYGRVVWRAGHQLLIENESLFSTDRRNAGRLHQKPGVKMKILEQWVIIWHKKKQGNNESCTLYNPKKPNENNLHISFTPNAGVNFLLQ